VTLGQNAQNGGEDCLEDMLVRAQGLGILHRDAVDVVQCRCHAVRISANGDRQQQVALRKQGFVQRVEIRLPIRARRKKPLVDQQHDHIAGGVCQRRLRGQQQRASPFDAAPNPNGYTGRTNASCQTGVDLGS
jgi:hypothetical protein